MLVIAVSYRRRRKFGNGFCNGCNGWRDGRRKKEDARRKMEEQKFNHCLRAG
ncbi:hypothetical protein [Microcoleus sp. D2_18a_B4]|uniref:hypothetical protein n=1 Tax=Microcoleus sp. D2_18a_B4 TaxID=3055329 RepID=UPI002FD438CE